jgi:hypothetical protein
LLVRDGTVHRVVAEHGADAVEPAHVVERELMQRVVVRARREVGGEILVVERLA